MRRCSLRFVNPVSEAAFVRSRDEKIVWAARFARGTLLAVSAFILFSQYLMNRRVPDLVVRMLEFFLCFCLFAVEYTRWFRTVLSPEVRERYFAVNLALLPLTRILTNSLLLLPVFDPRGIDAHEDADLPLTYGLFVLGLFGITTAAKICLPLRAFMLIPMDVVATLVMAIGTYFASSGPQGTSGGAWNVASFVVYLLVHQFGRRMSEICERELFHRIVAEKTLRFTAEREAERLAPEGEGGTAPGGRDDCARSTANTSALFAAMAVPGADPRAPLDRLLTLGREEHWLIDLSELCCDMDAQGGLHLLGGGSFGFVIPALYYGAPVALKAAWEKEECGIARHMSSFATELRVLRRLRHPNLVAYLGAGIDPSSLELVLVLERLQGTALHKVVARPVQDVSIATRLELASDVASALAYLHTRSPAIVHGDLKGNNVIVERLGGGERPCAKLLDFGLSKLLKGGKARGLGGTQFWRAPETLQRRAVIRTSADLYSYGWLLHMNITGRLPSDVFSSTSISEHHKSREPPELEWDPEAGYPMEVADLCHTCLSVDAKARPSVLQVLLEIRVMLENLEAMSSKQVSIADGLEKVRVARAERRAAHAQLQQEQELQQQSANSTQPLGCPQHKEQEQEPRREPDRAQHSHSHKFQERDVEYRDQRTERPATLHL